MADDRKERGRPDRQRINLAQRYEARYWSEKFGVSEEEVIHTVRVIGPVAEDVERYLRRKFRGLRR
jgi:Protein of unknown function (DUF3606)